MPIMRDVVEILASKPCFRVGHPEETADEGFLALYREVTGRDPVVLKRIVNRNLPPELIHIAYYVEFDTEEQLETFLHGRALVVDQRLAVLSAEDFMARMNLIWQQMFPLLCSRRPH